MMPAASLALAIEKRTNPLALPIVVEPSVSNVLELVELLIWPWLEAIASEPDPAPDQTFPSEAVPHPDWFGRWKLSLTVAAPGRKEASALSCPAASRV